VSRRLTGLAARAGEAEPASGDWRIEHMARLVDENRLGEEWDRERYLLLPRPDGLLVRRDPCRAPGCPNQLAVSSVPLCGSHAEQFAHSNQPSMEQWLQTGDIRPVRPRFGDRPCVVTGANGDGCGRPAVGSQRLCRSHLSMWLSPRIRDRGVTFEDYLAATGPLESLGECVAACCYLKAAYPQTRLCEVHYRYWKLSRRPKAAAFQVFLARAPQPANRRILSLRGLPVLVRLELLHGICCRMSDQVRTGTDDMRGYVDMLRATGVASVTDIAAGRLPLPVDAGPARFARYVFDRVHLAYADPDAERDKDVWDLRSFGGSGRLDFSVIHQSWLRQAAKEWTSASMQGRARSTLQHHIHALGVLSQALAGSPGGGHDPRALDRRDIERFLTTARAISSTRTGEPCDPGYVRSIVKSCALFLRDARDIGLLPTLSPTFAFRRADGGTHIQERDGRALPAHVVAQLDTHLDLLRALPGNLTGGTRPSGRGVLGERAGETAVLAYQLLKGTGRRAGEVASLHLDCLDVDEHDRPVLIYDNHKARRMARHLPIADTALVEAIQAQQAWVAQRFPHTPKAKLWLLPRPVRNVNGTGHIDPNLISAWMRAWVDRIPTIDSGMLDGQGQPVPFDRDAIHPHAFRHTYAQTLADQGVPAPVLRDLMDHRSIDTSLGYYKVGDAKKRDAMEHLARHTVNNRGVTRAGGAGSSRIANLREELSWVAVPMGKCSEPTNVKAGGGACPIRYQCAGCPHFESDPSYLPELRTYADQLRREREATIAVGAAEWVVSNVAGQLEVITGHIRHHESVLERLSPSERARIDEASTTLRKARQDVPVAFGRRQQKPS
jgi:integrase